LANKSLSCPSKNKNCCSYRIDDYYAQKTRIVVAIGLMITMLVASALLTGVLFSGAVIMTVKNPEKMANVKKKSNLLSGMFKLYT